MEDVAHRMQRRLMDAGRQPTVKHSAMQFLISLLYSPLPCSGVEGIELIVDKETGQCKGFGFVAFYNNAAADGARKWLSRPGYTVHGRQLTVTWADPKRNEIGMENVSWLHVRLRCWHGEPELAVVACMHATEGREIAM